MVGLIATALGLQPAAVLSTLKWIKIALFAVVIPVGCYFWGWSNGRQDLLEDALKGQRTEAVKSSKENASRAEAAASGIASIEARLKEREKLLNEALDEDTSNECECRLNDDQLQLFNRLIEEANRSNLSDDS